MTIDQIGPSIFVGLPARCLETKTWLTYSLEKVDRVRYFKDPKRDPFCSNSTFILRYYNFTNKKVIKIDKAGQTRLEPSNLTIRYKEDWEGIYGTPGIGIKDLESLALDCLYGHFPFFEVITENRESFHKDKTNKYKYEIVTYFKDNEDPETLWELVVYKNYQVRLNLGEIKRFNKKLDCEFLYVTKQSELGEIIFLIVCPYIDYETKEFRPFRHGANHWHNLFNYEAVVANPNSATPGLTFCLPRLRNTSDNHRNSIHRRPTIQNPFNLSLLYDWPDLFSPLKFEWNSSAQVPFGKNYNYSLPFQIERNTDIPQILLLPIAKDNWKYLNYLTQRKGIQWKDGRNSIKLALYLTEANCLDQLQFQHEPFKNDVSELYHLLRAFNRNSFGKHPYPELKLEREHKNKYLAKDLLKYRVERLLFPSDTEKESLYYMYRY